ncbi:AAA domain-containing protein [Nonomuraea sp. H19]|uniref:AAA domain-containing protein n=1 Tax=Nonomuraea sp. H19 TaxID=3452206 RepID=UPI003F88CB9B
MKPPTARTAQDPKVVETTIGLVRYLRDLARAGKRTIRDCGDYREVWWLAELPEEVSVRRDHGDTILLELAYEPHLPPPDLPPLLNGRIDPRQIADPWGDAPVLRDLIPSEGDARPGDALAITQGLGGPHEAAHKAWLPFWHRWADAERRAQPRRDLYQDLLSAARQISQHDDTLEAVLGVGLLRSAPVDRKKIHRHLITVRVDLLINRATTTITVKIAPEAIPRFEDRQFLEPEDGFAADRVEPVRKALRERGPHPLSDAMAEMLEEWHTRAFGYSAPFGRSWSRPDPADDTHITALAPALILRERDSDLVVECYQEILNTLEKPDVAAPLGLAQLVFDLEKDERIAWRTSSGQQADLLLGDDPLFPLPTNAAQRSVLKRLQHDTAVVVQGPPGTGKTHTIANLMAALLARGKRVLVTSAKDQALKVVRDQLPPALRDLCVQFSHRYAKGSDVLERTISAVSDRVASSDVEHIRQNIARLHQQRSQALHQRAHLQGQVFELRESETLPISAAPGYVGTRADIVEAVQRQAAGFGWIDPLPDSAAQHPKPPLTADEARELADLLQGADPERIRLSHEFLPAETDLPSPAEFGALVTATACEHEPMPTALGEHLAALPADQVEAIDAHCNKALDALYRLGMPGRAAVWGEADWRATALRCALSQRDQALWQTLQQMTQKAVAHQRALTGLGARQVTIAPASSEGSGAMVSAAQDLRRYLANRPERGWMRPKLIRQAERLLAGCTVDGQPPRTFNQVEALLIHLEADALVATLDEHWKHAGLTPRPGPLLARLSDLCDRATDLSAIASFAGAVQHIGAILRYNRLRHLIHTAEGWDELLDTIAWSHRQVVARQAITQLEVIAGKLTPRLNESAAAATRTLQRAVGERDSHAYEHGIDALSAAIRRKDQQRRCDALLDRLRTAHAPVAAAIADSPTDPHWTERLSQLAAAWNWGRAAACCRRFSDPDLDRKLTAALEEAERAVGDITADLAAENAWLCCLTRITQEQRQGLQAYKNRVSDLGKGTSKRYAERYRQGVRDAMALARDAVPAWIMPLPLVVETIRPEPDCFDVVIVDEASQMQVDSAFLLWLAPHVIVVGDDQQCTPSMISHGELKPIQDRIDQNLPDVRRAFRDDFAPKSNLYALLRARFPDVVLLTDHYRCMPEIIGWSSRQFYDDKLVPLRQFGAERLDPLQVVHVEDGYVEGAERRIRNEPEAKQIVDTLAKLFADPRYADKTFGVIVLQGDGQVRLLDRLIPEHIDAADIERYDLRWGQPPDFQGDQRDVILLSMVVTNPPQIASSKVQQQRFNVAASRARDQMWLFTSTPAHRLKHNDLRYSLQTWMSDPAINEFGQEEPADVSPDVPTRPFDSLFEQRVYLRIRERGYRVVPQVPAGGKRIDLVVVGAKGRLGVECDGRFWHTAPDQVRHDIRREQELRRAGWELWRLRESDFSLDPNRALKPLWRELDSRGIKPGVIQTRKPAGPSSWQPIILHDDEERSGDGTP